MNRRWMLVVAAVLLIVISAFTLVVIKRPSASPQEKKENVDSKASLLAQAKGLEDKLDLLAARAIYQKLANEFINADEIMGWQKKIEEINIKLLFSSAITPQSTLYNIKPGDTLTKIASEFKTTVDLIKKSNNLPDDKILPGRKIKVWTAPFSIFIDKSQNTLILKTGEEVIKTYIVSTGKDNSTPVGSFRIANKLLNPAWFKTGAVVPPESPENILGTRWMGFNLAGYGIHGTTEPNNLGKQATQGCVRMSNPEVEELYTIIPVGTEVTIVD
ncbi:MAG: L,D-transpeptidase family protein [Candidatus Omnitrophica bacterium]|nr:L,D-transpeptidase family protein [Candidatus Omnitrophota bacterium]